MEKFFVITNAQKDPELTVTRGIKEYLEEKGKTCLIPEKNPAADAGYRYTDARLIPGDVDCVLVVGGDGTLLQASRDLRGRDIPLLGINMGTLGYLAEIDRGGIRTALDRLIGGNYTVESRMMLSGCCERKGRVLLEDVALNDIVIGRCGRLRVVDFDIYVNGEFLNACSADGIIISTATGSTGYSLSVGGPIVSPEASLILISYIAPHTLNSRSIVLPADARVTVKVAGGHTGAEEGAEASFDGDTSVRLALGDTVTVSRSELVTKMVKTNNVSFLEVLRRKMSS
ncbi:MAG TPA: NAD(+)/NADH kinase [Candidatus Limivivens intestinipullorum]|uniref:NAD kinase n=1 Tax=Candidatus Limivivens intestinipullorum TaxID=2840858 RepID=A0A9D1ESD3_9FIRM|nr:NAD(+)/NADH kinase [Candidatus Limivivens intestinipullorum]